GCAPPEARLVRRPATADSLRRAIRAIGGRRAPRPARRGRRRAHRRGRLDPLDPVFGGLTLLGARMERHGAPAHPGSLLWVARWDDRSVVGMPTCGMFSQATTFDLVLPAILAGEPVGNREVAELGHGGLLSRDMAYRFP